jgi:hypothetical protein
VLGTPHEVRVWGSLSYVIEHSVWRCDIVLGVCAYIVLGRVHTSGTHHILLMAGGRSAYAMYEMQDVSYNGQNARSGCIHLSI